MPDEEAEMITGRSVVDHSGVGIGVVDERGEVYDHEGVHIGSVGDDGVVRDFSGIRTGRVTGAPAPEPVGAGRRPA